MGEGWDYGKGFQLKSWHVCILQALSILAIDSIIDLFSMSLHPYKYNKISFYSFHTSISPKSWRIKERKAIFLVLYM